MKPLLYILLPIMLLCGGRGYAQQSPADSLLNQLYPLLQTLENSGTSEAENLSQADTDSIVDLAASLLVQLLKEPLTDTIDFEKYPAIPRVSKAKGGRAKIINIEYFGNSGDEEFFAPVIQWRDELGENHAARLHDSCKYSMMDRLGETNTYITFCDTRLSDFGPTRKIQGMLVAGQYLETGLLLFNDTIPLTVPIEYCGFFYNADTDSFHFEEKECPDPPVITLEIGCDWKQSALRFNGEEFIPEKVK